MKNIYFLLTALILAFGTISCENQPVDKTKTPVLKFEKEAVTIPAEGGEVSINYQIEAIETFDASLLDITCDAEWLAFKSDVESVIALTATANNSAENRTAELVVGYASSEKVTISVTQTYPVVPGNEYITLEVTDVDATTITIDITTSHPELTWIPMVTYKDYWDETASHDSIFASDLEYFQYLADAYEVSLDTFLAEMVGTGSESGIVIEGLAPLTDYVVYVYGISMDAERTTDIAWVEASTEAPYEGDITFEFEVSEDNYILEFTITPSHRGVDYYYGMASVEEIESWKQLAGSDDLRDAIQIGDIEAGITRYMNYGFIDSRYDFFQMCNESSVMDYGWEELKGSTDYLLYAAKWNDNCELTGEVSFFEYTSPGVDPSDNIITMNVTEVTQSSVTVSMTATNFDPYVVIPVHSSYIEGMSDSEVFEFVINSYDYLISEYTFVGARTYTFGHMRPENNYTLLVFGHVAGIQTTQMWREDITTLAAGDPQDCTFEFSVVPGSDYARVQIIPSDKGHYYHWMLYPADYTAADAEAYIDYMINTAYEGDILAFSSWELTIGDEDMTVWDLTPSTEYKIGVVIMDYNSGELITDFIFDEVFSTLEATYADITINVEWEKYFDIDELIEAGYSQFADYSGQCLLPVKVTTEGDCAEFYYDIFARDLTDTELYPDDVFYNDLAYGSHYENTTFLLPYDTVMTLVAVAYDPGFNPSRIYREVLTFNREGASPAEEYGVETSALKASVVITPEREASNISIERTPSIESFVYTEEAETKREEAIANIEDARRENIERDIERRQQHHTNDIRRIAR